MNRMIAWFAENRVAANLLMVLIVVAGILSIPNTRKELIPNISLDMVSITVVYPGASPEEIEASVCVRIEEQVFDIEGIKKLTTRAQENACVVVAEVSPDYITRDVMDDIKARTDTITSFPQNTERPVIKEISIRSTVASVVISGQVDEVTLKHLAERVRDDLTELDSITHSWSLRVGGKWHDNEDISDIYYFGLRRSHMDFEAPLLAWLPNSGIDYQIAFSQQDNSLIEQKLFFDRKLPLRAWQIGLDIKLGLIWKKAEKYRGRLATEGPGDEFYLVLRPDIEF